MRCSNKRDSSYDLIGGLKFKRMWRELKRPENPDNSHKLREGIETRPRQQKALKRHRVGAGRSGQTQKHFSAHSSFISSLILRALWVSRWERAGFFLICIQTHKHPCTEEMTSGAVFTICTSLTRASEIDTRIFAGVRGATIIKNFQIILKDQDVSFYRCRWRGLDRICSTNPEALERKSVRKAFQRQTFRVFLSLPFHAHSFSSFYFSVYIVVLSGMLWSWKGQIVNKFLVEGNTKWGCGVDIHLNINATKHCLGKEVAPHFWKRLSVRFWPSSVQRAKDSDSNRKVQEQAEIRTLLDQLLFVAMMKLPG